MRRFFHQAVTSLYPRGTRMKRLAIRQHGHFEFKRAISYELVLKTPAGQTAKRIIRGNVPSTDTAKKFAIGAVMQKKLYRHGFAFGPYRVPLSLGFFRPLRLGLYENVSGQTLLALMTTSRGNLIRRPVSQAARWLASFHRSRLIAPTTRSWQQLRRDHRYFIDDFRRGLPTAVATVRAFIGELEKGLTRVFKKGQTVVHGDFHPANIILQSDGSVAVIDFANCSSGDPISDVASFLAQTDRLVWDDVISARRAALVKKTFARAYAAAVKRSIRSLQPALNYWYAWWIIQLLSYSVTIRPLPARQRLTSRGFAEIRSALTKLGHSIKVVDLTDVSSAAILRRHLLSKTVMFDFFNTHLDQLLPEAHHLETIAIDQPKAMSRSSYLTRYVVTITNQQGKQEVIILRGNFLPRQTYQLLTRLTAGSGLPILKPRLYLKRSAYQFYREVAGQRLREIAPGRFAFKNAVLAVATTAARLHRVRPAGLVWTQAAERRFLHQRAAVISRRDRAAGPITQALVKHLRQSHKRFWPRRPTLVHGDLQASNIIIGPAGQAWLIDFTSAKRFHPALDVATFLAHLDIMLLKEAKQPNRLRLRIIFLRRYYSQAGPALATTVRQALRYYELRAWLDIIAVTVTNLGPRDPNRQRYVHYLLARARGHLFIHD